MQEPDILVRGPLTVVGVETRTTNAAELDPATARIPAVWQEYFQARDRIGAAGGGVVGAYSNYESDHRGAYTLLVGSEVRSPSAQPHNLTVLRIPGGRYARFVAEGDMPGALIATWQRIWEYFDGAPAHARAYCVDYELHDAGGRTVEVFVGIE